MNLHDTDMPEKIGVKLVKEKMSKEGHSLTLKNSFGFGGVNVSLLLSRYAI